MREATSRAILIKETKALRKTERKVSSSVTSEMEELSLPTPAQGQGQEELARHEIRDRTAMGGMSQLELQHKLAIDVFLTDEDRATYLEARGTFRASPMQTQEDPFQRIDLAKVETPLPPKGPLGGHDALGAEGSLAPEGIMRPQGLLMSYGFMRPMGLMSPRSSMPQEQSPFQPQKLAPQNQPSAPTQTAPLAGAKQSDLGLPSGHEVRQIFQPVNSIFQSQIPSPWQKKGKSPFEEVIGRLLKFVASLFGFGGNRGYRGGKPELGR